MRSRLAHTLSLWLLGAVALSVLAMGGLTAWHLRQGFSAYLQARDLERFEKFVDLATDRLRQSAASSIAPHDRLDMPALLRELAVQEGIARPGRQSEPFDAGPPPRDAGPPMQHRPPPLGVGPPTEHRPPPPGPRPGGGPPRGNEDRFGSRVSLFLPDGRRWAGPPLPAGEQHLYEKPILINGEVIAIARLRPVQRAPEASEVQFLRSQFLGIAAVASGLLLLALAAGFWLARQWARPLAAIKDATARIARGEFDVRMPVQRSDEIGEVLHNVNAMAESLQRIEGTRRRWLADLSHELRTPLTVLRGEIEALVDGVRPLNAEAMASLREEVLRLGGLVDDLHLLAIADLQALPCHFAESDAVQIVQGVLKRHQRSAADAGVALGWAASAPTQPVPVCWDASRIEQLLANLLQNSQRYTDAPGNIELAVRADPRRVVVSVADSAPGVPDSDLPRIFEPLYRADATRGRNSGGSGLGLAICSAIAQAHGGCMRASRSSLGGLLIEIDLPSNPAQDKA